MEPSIQQNNLVQERDTVNRGLTGHYFRPWFQGSFTNIYYYQVVF